MLAPRTGPSSSRTRKTKSQTPEEALRTLSRLTPNRKCADCTEKLPQYLNMKHGTFVCTACSGIHREFSHRVKSISLCEFTSEEVCFMQGN